MSSNIETREESASQIAAQFVNVMQDFISPRSETVKGLFMSNAFDGPSSSFSDPIPKPHLKRARSPSDDRDDGRPLTRLKLNSEKRTTITDGDRHTTSSPYPLLAGTSSQTYSHRPDAVREIRFCYPPNGPFRHDMTFEFEGDELTLLRRWANRHNAFE